MKAINTILKILVLSVVFVSCSTEDPAELDPSLHNNGNTTPPTEVLVPQDIVDSYGFPEDRKNVFQFKVDGGTLQEEAFNQAFVATDDAGNTTLTLSGLKDGKALVLRLPPAITSNDVTNPYPLGDANTDYVAYYNTSNTQQTVATSGDLNIAIHNTSDKVIIGSFSFDSTTLGVDPPVTYSITEGLFKIWYGQP